MTQSNQYQISEIREYHIKKWMSMDLKTVINSNAAITTNYLKFNNKNTLLIQITF